MAKKQNGSSRTTLEEVNESLSSAAQRIEDNKKYIYWALCAVLVVVLLALGYIYGVRNPGSVYRRTISRYDSHYAWLLKERFQKKGQWVE